MKVLFLARWYPSRDNAYYGVFVREHAKAVRASGCDVAVLHIPGVPGKGRGLWRMEEETDPRLTEGIPTFHVYARSVSVRGIARISYWISTLLYVWSTLRAVRRLRGHGFRPDVLHAHVWSAGVPAVIVGRLLGLPVVVTEHSTVFQRHAVDRSALRRSRYVFEHSARVLPVCANLQQAISDYGVKASFEIVPNAVDTAIFFPSEKGHSAGSRRLIFVGNLEPTGHKGFPTLVEALVELGERRRDWHLDVVGDGPTRAEYERLVAHSGLSGSIVFHGSKPKDEVAALMRASDLFVLPSRFENLPCVIIEAMTSGLPVVATAVGGVPEMVSERDGILVPPENPAALADALDHALSNLSAFDRDDIAARARDRYSLEAVGAQLRAVYESVLASSRKKAAAPDSTPSEP